jgi:hypothetical protein
MKIIRIVLLIANGLYLVLSVVGVVAFLRAADVLSLLSAIPLVVFIFLLAGNFAYILRCPPRTKHASDRQLVDTF